MRFRGRGGIVTGAAGALGSAAARLLAKQGARLLLFDRNRDALENLASECAGSEIFSGDVTSSADLAEARKFLEARQGPADLVVAAAGIAGPVASLVDIDEESFDRVFAVNVKGAWLTAKTFIPGMRKLGRGSMVLFSSTAGIVGSPILPAYSASKGAVTLLTRSLAVCHAAENIRVNCVCPGTIDSPMADHNFAELPEGPERTAAIALMRSRHPMQRFGTADEVANTVAFLLSDEAAFTTGAAIPVDGGRLA